MERKYRISDDNLALYGTNVSSTRSFSAIPKKQSSESVMMAFSKLVCWRFQRFFGKATMTHSIQKLVE
jgi:hypothetical protein